MNLDFEKYADGLVPVIVQDANTRSVLMLGFMNAEAISETQSSGRVTFFSRSKGRLWTKGDTSGNYLEVVSICTDCDRDTLLIKANPAGPVCHTGTQTCFGDESDRSTRHIDVLTQLESVIDERREQKRDDSYVADLFAKGINKIAQKVGEEAFELVIEAKDENSELFKSEAADLLFHYLILLRAKDVSIKDVIGILAQRRK